MGQGIKPAVSFQGPAPFSTHIYIYCQPTFAHLGRSSPSHGAIYLLSAGGIWDHHTTGHVILLTQLTKSRRPLSSVIFTQCSLRQTSMSVPECKESLPEEKTGKDLMSTDSSIRKSFIPCNFLSALLPIHVILHLSSCLNHCSNVVLSRKLYWWHN